MQARCCGIPIHHVVNVNFGGFRRAVNRLGCVYVDVDRRYFNDNDPPSGGGADYATIDVKAGYQKLCGQDSLDYVRYRHLDTDFVRAARQQDFLRQAKDQIGVGKLFGDREELLRIFGRYTQTDIARHARRSCACSSSPSSRPRTRSRRSTSAASRPATSSWPIAARTCDRTVDEFLNVEASPGRARAGEAHGGAQEARKRSSASAGGGRAPGLVVAQEAGEDQAVDVATQVPLPVYFPKALKLGGRLPAPTSPRAYDIYDRDKHSTAPTGWSSQHGRDRPVLRRPGHDLEGAADPRQPDRATVAWRGRTLRALLRRRPPAAGRLAAPKRAVYWVSNTLLQTLTNSQMLAHRPLAAADRREVSAVARA